MNSSKHFLCKFEELFLEVMDKRVKIAERHAKSVKMAFNTLNMKPDNFSWTEWMGGMLTADTADVKPQGYIHPSDKEDVERLDELIDLLIPIQQLRYKFGKEDSDRIVKRELTEIQEEVTGV